MNLIIRARRNIEQRVMNSLRASRCDIAAVNVVARGHSLDSWRGRCLWKAAASADFKGVVDLAHEAAIGVGFIRHGTATEADFHRILSIWAGRAAVEPSDNFDEMALAPDAALHIPDRRAIDSRFARAAAVKLLGKLPLRAAPLVAHGATAGMNAWLVHSVMNAALRHYESMPR